MRNEKRGRQNKVPKVIHQTWKSKKLEGDKLEYSQKWRKLHPDYDYRFYDDKDLRELVERTFPHFLRFYDNFTSVIERVDFARYVMLYVYGGIYSDLDVEPFENLDGILSKLESINKVVLLEREPSEHDKKLISNAVMISKRCVQSRLFWRKLVSFIVSTYEHNQSPVDTTGPGALRRFFNKNPEMRSFVAMSNGCLFNSVTNRETPHVAITANGQILKNVSKECATNSVDTLGIFSPIRSIPFDMVQEEPIEIFSEKGLRPRFWRDPEAGSFEDDLINAVDRESLISSLESEGVIQSLDEKKIFAAHRWMNSWVRPWYKDPRFSNKRYWCYALSILFSVLLVLSFFIFSPS